MNEHERIPRPEEVLEDAENRSGNPTWPRPLGCRAGVLIL